MAGVLLDHKASLRKRGCGAEYGQSMNVDAKLASDQSWTSCSVRASYRGTKAQSCNGS
jgi:hypothetical protein